MQLSIEQLGLGKQATQLIREAGFLEAQDIARTSLSEFVSRLTQTNNLLGIYKKLPDHSKMASWQAASLVLWEEKEQEAITTAHAAKHSVNYELDPDVVEMLDIAPLAIPLPAKILAEYKIPVHEIQQGILLSDASGDLSIRVTAKVENKSAEEGTLIHNNTHSGAHIHSISFQRQKHDVNFQKLKTIEAHQTLQPSPTGTLVTPLKQNLSDQDQIVRVPLPETNSGKKPTSRFFIKGVLHNNPQKMWWGAFITSMLFICIPLGIVISILLVLLDQLPEHFHWVSQWFLIVPLAIPVLGILYATISLDCRCRVCGQKCFVPKNCLKNEKAHYIPIIGYIFPTALHLMIFRWFRCIFCGTAIRVKK